MFRSLALIAGCAVALAGGAAATSFSRQHAPMGPTSAIGFTLELALNAEGFQLRLDASPKSMVSQTYATGELAGLMPGALDRDGALRFALAREAGRIECDGMATHRVGSGRCSFAPDAAFARYLAERGVGMPDFRGSYDLTVLGARRALVEALATARYQTPTVDQLIALTAIGVTPDYIADLSRSGFHPDDLDDLMAFAALRIDGAYAGAMLRAGAGKLRSKDLIALRAVGVAPAYVAELVDAGLRDVSADTLAQLKAIGVDGAYLRDLATVGFAQHAADELTAMRAVGVTAEDVRHARAAGIANPTAEQLVQLRVMRR